MATWITHLMVADFVMQKIPWLDRRGFCVGNIAPDCNIENEDWSAFTPSREVTHWMSGAKKAYEDAERFLQEYLIKRTHKVYSKEEFSFLLGYYSHLVADAEYQRMTRDPDRVVKVWNRIDADLELSAQAINFERSWDSVKILVSKKDRFREIYSIEGEYLRNNPLSGYITEILPLKEFPDYIDYLSPGAIIRKIPKMRVRDELLQPIDKYISITKDEVETFMVDTAEKIVKRIDMIGDNYESTFANSCYPV